MLQSITAAVTKSVLGELQKAGIIASQSQHDGQIQHDTQSITQPGGPPNHAHPDQHQDNELSQTVTTAPPDEAQQRASSTTTLNNIDSVQLPAMLFANTTKKTDGMSEFSNTSYKPLGRPLYTQINGKLQEKISANEFVDMADILDPPSDLEPYDFHLSVKHNGRVCLSSGKKKKYLTIETWTDAFIIFAFVLRQGNKGNSDMNLIRSLQKDGGDWYNYDATFRKAKQADISLSWRQVDQVLYSRSLMKKWGGAV